MAPYSARHMTTHVTSQAFIYGLFVKHHI